MGPANAAMPLAPIAAEARSAAWDDVSTPAASIVVATHNRAAFLIDLLEALTKQLDVSYEVLLVDDGSSDETWSLLTALIPRQTAAVRALRLSSSHGPSVARNVGVNAARAPRIAFTDDDCLPTPEWLGALLEAGPALVAQGATLPHGSRTGPWDRSIRVTSASPLYETCNLAVDRDAFVAASGFPELRLLPGPTARGFGEDAVLGAALAETGGRAWAPDAVVRHRWLPGSYPDYLRGLVRLVGFPALARDVPEIAQTCWHGVFLSRRTAAFDVGLAGVVAAALTRRALPVGLVVPYLVLVRNEPAHRGVLGIRGRVATTGQLALGDLVGLAALVRGSVRARRLLI
jgi:glycosyltransferase involved in cell wall biosynthesis